MNRKKDVIVIAIIIVTDSTCDLLPEDQARLNVEVIPLTIHFSNETYMDGIDISNEQFFDKLDRCHVLPTTSQVSPQRFCDLFSPLLDGGNEIVGIFISSEISGTYQSANMAKEMLKSDKIHIIDSRSATMSLALLVSEAAKHRDAGFSAPEIVSHVTALAKRVRFLAAVNTLKYLRKGGRISATTAVVGELLGIKPIVSIIDGTIHSIDKARGMSSAIAAMLQNVKKDLPDLRYGVVFCSSCAPELLDKMIASFKDPLKITNWITCSIGSVIGTYAGRGVIGFSYISKGKIVSE